MPALLLDDGGYKLQVDDTLTVSGIPADAKVVGGEISKLSQEIADQILVLTESELESLTQEELAEKHAKGTKIIITKDEYDNLVSDSISENGTIYNGCGYMNGYRLSSSGEISEAEQAVLTGFIPYTYGKEIVIEGGLQGNNYGGQYIATYTDGFELIGVNLLSVLVPNSGGTSTFNDENVRTDVIKTSSFSTPSIKSIFETAKFIRVSVNPCIGKDMKVSYS